MTETNVHDRPLTEPAAEAVIEERIQAAKPTGYAATAAELRRIAVALDALPPVDREPYVTLSFLPGAHDATPEQKIADVDAVARAVLGRAGKTEESTRGNWFHIVREARAGVHITVQESIPGPPDEREAELARLRAENERLRAAVTGPSPEQLAAVAAKLRADQAAACEAHTPTGPCVLPKGHDELCSPEPLSGIEDCPTCGGDHHTVEPCR